MDYYESMRMARIINHTRSDPDSLNIDLDVFMGVWRHFMCAILCSLFLFSVDKY